MEACPSGDGARGTYGWYRNCSGWAVTARLRLAVGMYVAICWYAGKEYLSRPPMSKLQLEARRDCESAEASGEGAKLTGEHKRLGVPLLSFENGRVEAVEKEKTSGLV